MAGVVEGVIWQGDFFHLASGKLDCGILWSVRSVFPTRAPCVCRMRHAQQRSVAMLRKGKGRGADAVG
jgi:hypothetical protein